MGLCGNWVCPPIFERIFKSSRDPRFTLAVAVGPVPTIYSSRETPSRGELHCDRVFAMRKTQVPKKKQAFVCHLWAWDSFVLRLLYLSILSRASDIWVQRPQVKFHAGANAPNGSFGLPIGSVSRPKDTQKRQEMSHHRHTELFIRNILT